MRGRYVFNLESLCPCELVHTAVAQLRVSLIMGNEHNRWGYHAAQLQAGDPKRRAIANPLGVRRSYDNGPHRDRPVHTPIGRSGSIIRRSKPKRNRGGLEYRPSSRHIQQSAGPRWKSMFWRASLLAILD